MECLLFSGDKLLGLIRMMVSEMPRIFFTLVYGPIYTIRANKAKNLRELIFKELILKIVNF